MSTQGLTASIKRPIRQLAIREKIEAIDRVHTGESKASVARDIGVPESTLRGWCKSEEKLRTVARTCGTPESQHSEPDKERLAGDGCSDRKRARSEEFHVPLSLHPAADVYRLPATTQPDAAVNMTLPHRPEGALNMTKSQLNHQSGTRKSGLAHPISATNGTATKVQPEVDDALWYWLKHQQQSTLGSSLGGLDRDGSWFWRWYKNFGYSQFSELPVPKVDEHVATPVVHPESDDDDDEPPATAAEAVNHGEKFLRWLECCSDPSVTAMQILQFRYLLNNVRACADRRAKHAKTNTRPKPK